MTEQEINNLIDSKIGKTKMSQLPEATQTSGLYSIGYTGNQSVKYKANLLQGDPLTVRKTYQTEALALADKNPIDTTTSLPLTVGQFVSIVDDGEKNGIYRISSISGDGTMSLELQGKLGDLSEYAKKVDVDFIQKPNKLNPLIKFPIVGYYHKNSGNILTDADMYISSQLIPVKEGMIFYNDFRPTGNSAQAVFFDENERFISSTVDAEPIIVPEGAHYVAFSAPKNEGEVYYPNSTLVEIISMPLERKQESEISAINNELNFIQKPNKLNPLIKFPIDGYYYADSGKIGVSDNFESTELIPVKEGMIFYSDYRPTGRSAQAVFFDGNESFISSTVDAEPIVVPEGAHYVGFTVPRNGGEIYYPDSTLVDLAHLLLDLPNTSQDLLETLTDFPIDGYYFADSGKIGTDVDRYISSQLIPVKEGMIFYNDFRPTGRSAQAVFFDGNKSFISSTVDAEPIVVPEGAHYVGFTVPKGEGEVRYPLSTSVRLIIAPLERKQEWLEVSQKALSSISPFPPIQMNEPRTPINIDNTVKRALGEKGSFALPSNNEDAIKPPLFCFCDDDLNENFLRSGKSGGYLSTVHPVFAAHGVPCSIAVIGSKAWDSEGNAIIHGDLEPEFVMKTLCDKYGWEMVSHGRNALSTGSYAVNSRSEADSLGMNSFDIVNGVGIKIYAIEENKDYTWTESGWVETDLVQPFLFSKESFAGEREGTTIGDHPLFDMHKEFRGFQQLMEEKGLGPILAHCTHRSTFSHKILNFIRETYPYVYSASGYKVEPSVGSAIIPPICSVTSRIGIDSSSPGSTSPTENRDLEGWKDIVDKAFETGGICNYMMHHGYGEWENKNDAITDYDPTWEIAVGDPSEYPETFHLPNPDTGLTSWKDWKPVEGTRLRDLYDLIGYIKSKGGEVVTVSEALRRRGNLVSIGDFTNGRRKHSWDKNKYPHYVLGVNGAGSYFNE